MNHDVVDKCCVVHVVRGGTLAPNEADLESSLSAMEACSACVCVYVYISVCVSISVCVCVCILVCVAGCVY